MNTQDAEKYKEHIKMLNNILTFNLTEINNMPAEKLREIIKGYENILETLLDVDDD
jgi:hypothetical protein